MRIFLETHGLASLASFFRKSHYGTWQHPRSKQQHQLDHVLATHSALGRFSDAGSRSGQLIGSDHRAFSCKLRVGLAAQLQRKRVNARSNLARLDYSSLRDKRAAAAFSNNVLERLGLVPPTPPPLSTPLPPPLLSSPLVHCGPLHKQQ